MVCHFFEFIHSLYIKKLFLFITLNDSLLDEVIISKILDI